MSDDFSERRPYNAVSDFVDANVARGLASKIAFIDPDRSLSYGDLQALSCQFARALQRLGLRQESRIALLLPDTVDYPVAFWGAVRAGIVVIPLNTWLKPEQYAYILGDSRVSLIVAAAELAKPLAPIIDAAPYLQDVVLVGGTTADKAAFPQHAVHLFEELLAPEKARRIRRTDSLRRSRLLALHVRLDRRSQGRQARAHQPDGDRQADGSGRHRHSSRRRDVLGGQAVLCLRHR